MPQVLKVQGLAEFTRNLKKLNADLPKMQRRAFNSAADLLVAQIRPLVPTRSGTARASVKSASTATAARVTGGGNKAPYYPWLDFGGKVGRIKSVSRPFYTDGRYIYGTYFRDLDTDAFTALMVESLLQSAADAGVEVD
jgi:hypothetical protein